MTVTSLPLTVTMPSSVPLVGHTTDIVYWSEEDDTWYITDRGTVEGNSVTFQVEHFSAYASIGGDWSAVFANMDKAVGSASSEEAVSAAVVGFLQDEIWEKMGIKDLRIATRAAVGGESAATCAKSCGIFGFWSAEKDGGTTRQGGGRYKEQSKNNIIILICLSDREATSHLKEQLEISSSQEVVSRKIQLDFNACATDLEGHAKDSKIEKGKTTEVTIKASCGGDALADQLIQLSYSPELSCDVVNKKTDANGEIKITVKGVEEGKGIVYAKAVSGVDSDLETEIQIPVKVGGGDTWEIEFRLPVTLTSRVTGPDRADEGIGESTSEYENVRAFSFSTEPKSVSFTIVGHARFTTGATVIEGGREWPGIKGTSYIGIEEGSVSYDFPDFHTSWEYWYDGKISKKVEDVHFTYDVKYEINKWPEYEFAEMAMLQYTNRARVAFYENDEALSLLKDNTLYTKTESGISYSYDDKGIQHQKSYSETTGPLRTVTGLTRYIWPGSLSFNLEEGTFPLYHSGNTSPEVQLAKDNYVLFASNLFADCFFAEMEYPYRGCFPKIEDEVESNGTITIRRVEEDEKE